MGNTILIGFAMLVLGFIVGVIVDVKYRSHECDTHHVWQTSSYAYECHPLKQVLVDPNTPAE